MCGGKSCFASSNIRCQVSAYLDFHVIFHVSATAMCHMSCNKKKKNLLSLRARVCRLAMGFQVGAQIHCQENNGPFIPAFGQHYQSSWPILFVFYKLGSNKSDANDCHIIFFFSFLTYIMKNKNIFIILIFYKYKFLYILLKNIISIFYNYKYI